MIKIALVDDHVVLRKSLAVLINMLQDFKVTIEAGNGGSSLNSLKKRDCRILPCWILRCR